MSYLHALGFNFDSTSVGFLKKKLNHQTKACRFLTLKQSSRDFFEFLINKKRFLCGKDILTLIMQIEFQLCVVNNVNESSTAF